MSAYKRSCCNKGATTYHWVISNNKRGRSLKDDFKTRIIYQDQGVYDERSNAIKRTKRCHSWTWQKKQGDKKDQRWQSQVGQKIITWSKGLNHFGSRNEDHLKQQSLVSWRINFLRLNDYTKRNNKKNLVNKIIKPINKDQNTTIYRTRIDRSLCEHKDQTMKTKRQWLLGPKQKGIMEHKDQTMGMITTPMTNKSFWTTRLD